MNNRFNLNRFFRVLRWNYLDNRKKFFRLLVGLVVCYSALCLFDQTCYFMDFDPKVAENNLKDYVEFAIGAFLYIAFILFWVGGSTIFRNMRTQQMRATYLLLPAANSEKFLARWIWTVGSCLALPLMMLVICDVIQYLFSYILPCAVHASIIVFFFVGILGDSSAAIPWSYQLILTIGACLLLPHSLFVLGGALFRKHPILLTIVTFYLLFMVLFSTLSAELNFFLTSLFDRAATSGVLVLSYAIILFNHVCAYRIFTRMQVISNKWLNL